MGSEFLKKTKKTIVKSVDAGRVRLGTSDLFTKVPLDQLRCAIATLERGATINAGEMLIAEPRGKELILSRGNNKVARIKRPTTRDLEAIKNSSGVAKAEVKKINKISRTADISLC